MPGKIEIGDLLDNQLIITLNEDWKPEGSTTRYSQGSVLSFDLDGLKQDPLHLSPTLIFAASTHEFVQSVAVTKNRLLITMLDHVQGRAYVYRRDATGEWTQRRLHVPDNVSVSIVTASNTNDKFFLSVTGFTTPTTLLLGDTRTASLRTVKTSPSQFNATDLVVEQMETSSTDGTKIPYLRSIAKIFDTTAPIQRSYRQLRVNPKFAIVGNAFYVLAQFVCSQTSA